mmetsp:Transcript_21444/g.24917  ORF Transcript_21444/g.24917 Transcript_21444/m.24917 type:complete len:1083 (+) Transcript_21444:84-3332(+)|eukprot:CAMPEP_0176444566 /NCGR_PEP_ID=MMETSP0127-20121128/23143_1 /TAXON_ID=938130 /ORGANISM="Platyophrya macrostoma, Strain WH" /LENGTH=1082 /DNA_ID=CAMNT_0017830107 /DNA_START=84 /DNA_END=3332 /DNA_ORIENTATION=+
MDQVQFEQLLVNLSNPDNLTRKAAEERYEQLRTADALWTMHAVTEICATTTSEAALSMSIILLRKLFASSVDCYDKATPEVRAAIKIRMLEIFAKNAANKNSKSAAACVSALAAKVVAIGDDWSELWTNLFATITNTDSSSAHRGACCEVIAHTATMLATTYLKGHQAELAKGLNNCLLDPVLDVKKSAFAAVQAVTQIVDAKTDLNHFKPLVRSMLTAVETALNTSDWTSATALCSSLADCIEHNAPLFAHETTAVLQAMMQVASSPQVSKEARHMAVEVMTTYSETEPKAVKKVPGFTKALFELLFKYMLNPEIASDWDVTKEDEDADDLEGISDLDIGCTSLDRIATSIKAKQLQEIAQGLFMENVHSPNWQNRNAALIMLTYVSEGLRDVFMSQLGNILQVVVPMVSDENKVVRESAVTCLSQFSNDFAPEIQTQFHGVVIPPLRQALRDLPRIASVAAGGLNSFFDNAEDGDDDDEAVMMRLSPYVHDCCVDLVQLYNATPIMFVKGDCLGALSAIIATCKSSLTPYVTDLVPIFQAVLQLSEDASTPEGRVIRSMKCKALECTTLLACGVGKQHFAQYAHPVCEYLNSLLAQNLPNDDPRLRYVLRGWTCMVECLKEDVLPYLSNVLPPLLAVANLDCDLEIVKNEVGDEDDEDDENDDVKKVRLCLPGLGEQTVKIHTSLIEDKELATTIILSILEELKGKLAPYLLEIANMAVKLLDFSATGDVRENGCQLISTLAESYKEGAQAQLVPFLNHVIPALLKAAKEESEMSVLGEMLTSLCKCLDNTPAGALSNELVHDIGARVHTILVDSVARRKKVIQAKAQEQEEEELDALEDEDETEQFLLSECNSAVGSLLRNCTQQFLPVFLESYLSAVATLTAEGMDDTDVKSGLVMLCDFVEYGQAASVPHISNIAHAFLQFATKKDEMVQQASFYGLGLLVALVHGAFPQPHAESVQLAAATAEKIASYLGGADARKEEFEDCTANVVSAAVKVIDLFGQSNAFDTVRLAQQMLNFLPISGDDVEAARVHETLLKWVVSGHWLFTAIPTAQQMILAQLKKAKPSMMNAATKQQLATM